MKETKWTKYYGDFVKAPDMEVDKTIYQALKEVALKNKDSIAIEYLNVKISYQFFLNEIDRCASAFVKLGVHRGDVVTICSSGTPHSVICIYALSKIGAIASVITLDSRHTGFINPINKTKSTVIVMTAIDFKNSYEVLKKTTISKVIICKYNDYFNPKNILDWHLWQFKRLDSVNYINSSIKESLKVFQWNSFIKASAQISEYSDCSTPVLYYNGGTATNDFNIVEFNSEALNNMARLCTALYGSNKRRVLCFVRVAFSFGFSFGIHSVLLTGNTCLIKANQASEFPSNAVNKYCPDIVIGYPQMLEGFINNKKLKASAIKGIKTVFTAATYMPSLDYADLVESFRKKGSKCEVVRLYGITETCSACAFNPPYLDNDRILGIPIPGVRMRIINPDTGLDAHTGEIGSIAVNTPAMMSGYLDNPTDTSKLIHKHQDGRYWILTGDLGHEDEDGIFYFDGSKRRLFDRGGYHVYPSLIENEICTVFGVDECCVIPVGEGSNLKIKAIIQPEQEYLFDNDKLNDLKNELETMTELEVASYMIPDEYEFVAYLPKNAYGRIDFDRVIELFKEDKDEQVDKNDIGDDFDFSDGF